MHFNAPWATAVKVTTVVFSGLLLYVAFGVGRRLPDGPADLVWFFTTVLPLLLLFGSMLFVVRGYRLEPTRMMVERLLWSTEIELTGLQRVWHDPAAMKHSWRLFGNGGLFVIAGLFSNKKLGRYRAYATDPKNAVVLDLGGRKIVATPGAPAEFVRQLRSLRPDLASDQVDG